jgi:hypothetical protein
VHLFSGFLHSTGGHKRRLRIGSGLILSEHVFLLAPADPDGLVAFPRGDTFFRFLFFYSFFLVPVFLARGVSRFPGRSTSG